MTSWAAWWTVPQSWQSCPGHEWSFCPEHPAHYSLSSHLSYQIDCRGYHSACVQVTLILFNNGPKAHGFDPCLGKIPWGGHDNPLQYSCLEDSMDRGAWRAAVHRVTKSWTQLKRLGTKVPRVVVLAFEMFSYCAYKWNLTIGMYV